MDKAELISFCDFAIGGRLLSADEHGNEFTTPHAPGLRAFIVARLGDDTPTSGYAAVLQPVNWTGSVRRAKAFAALLREVANGIDPPEAA